MAMKTSSLGLKLVQLTEDKIMAMKTNARRLRLTLFTIAFMMVLIPFCTAFAQSEGITIEKDVLLEWPILGAEDLPDAVTFSLYDSENALVPLATQSFSRGQYVLDFEFNKSDGLSSGSIARFKVNFTNKLDLENAADSAGKPNAIWSEFSVGDTVIGARDRLPDDTMVQLLLASDASIATYLTLAYEGDANPITTIYKDLPLSSLNSNFSGASLSTYFSTLPTAVSTNVDGTRAAENWIDNGTSVYTNGNVGIANAAPDRALSVKYASNSGFLNELPTVSVVNPHVSTGPYDFSFSSFEFTGGNGAAVGEFFADGSGYFLGGTPNVFFRAGEGTAMVLGAGKSSNMTISTAGNVGIGLREISGTETVAANKLDVYGTIRCKELIVTSTWSDFVFEDNYKLPALSEVEDFIAKNGHLPGIPSEAEVKEKGVSVGSISSKLLQKIEELTLYVIDLKRENQSLKGQLTSIQEQLGK